MSCATNSSRADEPSIRAQIVAAVECYGKAWDDPNPDTRAALLTLAWAKDGLYRDGSITIKGAEALSLHMGEFLQKYPKAHVSATSRLDSFGPVFRAAWRLDFGNGATLDGFDCGKLNAAPWPLV